MADDRHEGRQVQVHGEPRLSRSREPGYGERFWLSTAAVVLSLLWITAGLALWATILCGAAAAVGAVSAVHFARCYIRSRRQGS